MARVFLLSATPQDDETDFNLAPLSEAKHCAEIDRSGVHSLTTDPAAADLIIFVEFYGGGWDFERGRRPPPPPRHPEKSFFFFANPPVISFLSRVFARVGGKNGKTRAQARVFPCPAPKT